ncbi:Fur-regulated basic protein FbpA [Bacillus cereus]|uniref:Fur-regulated basic protein FbpA n=1 Tax=Bacillus sp. AFS023182 TaxID=2033492 RepID=UPI000BF62382|nr:Fur-regulated basic protein FbpA [Bacillus sp. AFS023182]PFE05067.1 Fur-regulated basic protein FbpA [Bacillus sp. AFS023182]PGY02992.1 Fur-regulated basic protein FbpA [Bacillus cereus]
MDLKEWIIEQLISNHRIYKMEDGRQLYELSAKELQELLKRERNNDGTTQNYR